MNTPKSNRLEFFAEIKWPGSSCYWIQSDALRDIGAGQNHELKYPARLSHILRYNISLIEQNYVRTASLGKECLMKMLLNEFLLPIKHFGHNSTMSNDVSKPPARTCSQGKHNCVTEVKSILHLTSHIKDFNLRLKRKSHLVLNNKQHND